MNFKYSILVGAVASALLAFQPASAQSLGEAVDQTIKTNPDVMIDVNRRLQTDQNIKQAQGGYFPKIDLSAGIGEEHSDNTTTRNQLGINAGRHNWRSLGRGPAYIKVSKRAVRYLVEDVLSYRDGKRIEPVNN